MKFFSEVEPDIFLAAGRLETEDDGNVWTAEYDALVARERPIAVIANVADRPQPAAGKPMILWMKARRDDLARLVKLTVYVAEDAAERSELERNLPGRTKTSPYPMAETADNAAAMAKARGSLSHAA